VRPVVYQEGVEGGGVGAVRVFVEASREMTVMGREVMSLKGLVGKQVDTIKAMKNVDFELDFVDQRAPPGMEYDPDDESGESSDMDQSSSRRAGRQ